MINVNLDLKPIPAPLEYQPIYKIALLICILKYGCSKPHNATLLKLHIYMWALLTEENLNILLEAKAGTRTSLVPWTFQPGMEKVITLSIINGFCIREIKSALFQVKLTSGGAELINRLEAEGIFTEKIDQIKRIGIIPQKTIKLLNSNWKIN